MTLSRIQWRRNAAAAALFASAFSACSCSETPAQSKTTDDVRSVQVVPAARVVRTNITTTATLTAEFQPFQEVDVMAKVAGYVRSIKVDLGDRVREGQVLAELEVPEMTDEVSKAAAMVAQTASEISAASDELKRVESAHQIAHLSFTRLQEVASREAGLIPQQEIDEAKAKDLVAEAQLASAKSKLRVEENKTHVARAEEARLRTMRNYITITAPFAGTVTRRYANVGSMIQAGIASQSQAMPIVRLSQLSTLRLSLPVPESLVPSVKLGKGAEVHVKSLNRTFEGRVARFAARIDPSTRTMITEVDVSNPSGVILPGMYAQVDLDTIQRNDVVAAPVDAVERTGTAARVYVVDSSGVVRVTPVQLGIEDAHQIEITAGLNESDVVITGRRSGLKPGDKVSPKILDTNEQAN